MRRLLILFTILPFASFATDPEDVDWVMWLDAISRSTGQSAGLLERLDDKITSGISTEATLKEVQYGIYSTNSRLDTSNNHLQSIYSLLSPWSSYVQAISSNTSGLKGYLSDINTSVDDLVSYLEGISSNTSGLQGYLSDINTSVDDLVSYLEGIRSDTNGLKVQSSAANSTLGQIYNSLGQYIGSDVSSIKGYLSDIKTSVDGLSSDFEDLAKESTLSSMYDSIGDNVGTDLSAIQDVIGTKGSYTLSDLITKFNKPYNVPFNQQAFYRVNYNQSDPTRSTLIRTNLVGDNQSDFFLQLLWWNQLHFQAESYLNSLLVWSQTGSPLFQNVQSILDKLDDYSSSYSSIDSHLGNIENALNLTTIVELLSTISGDVSSILSKMDDSSDDDDDSWSEFREKYLSLFDNQPIPTYEIEWALIGWETNSVATKQTLTAQSGDFFSLCLGFLIDANKVSASQSIFLKHILDYLPKLKPPEAKDTTEDENRVNGQITDVSGQISTLNHTFNYEDLIFKEESVDFFDHDTITGQFDDESLPANVTIVIPPIFNFQTQAFTISTAGFSDFFDYTRAFCAVLYYVLLCGFIWFVFKCFLLCCSKFGKVIGFVMQW